MIRKKPELINFRADFLKYLLDYARKSFTNTITKIVVTC